MAQAEQLYVDIDIFVIYMLSNEDKTIGCLMYVAEFSISDVYIYRLCRQVSDKKPKISQNIWRQV